MGAWLGVPEAPTEPKSRRNRRPGAGKEAVKASEKQTVPDAVTGVTTGGVADDATAGTTVASRHSTLKTAVPLDPEVHIDQCGLEDDSDLEPWEPGPRIRTSQLSPEEQAKFRAHLDVIFSKQILLGSRYIFHPADVMEVMQKVIPYLKSEPMLIEDVRFDVAVVGDLHGQLYDLDRVFKHDEKEGKPGWECRKYVFLGNYVDRGRQSLEVIMALFCIKMLYPNDIFLLRGNHEFTEMNICHGLRDDIATRYKDDAKMIFFQINETFCWLSVAAIVGDVYLCVHAGVSAGVFTRRAMRGIYKPFFNSGDDNLVHDIVWSDSARGLRGTVFNAARGTSFVFGTEHLVWSLHSMGVIIVIRGHTVVANGHEAHTSCLQSIYSATNHREAGNKGAVAEIDAAGKMSVRILEVDKNRTGWERVLRELDGDEPYEAKDAGRVDDWMVAHKRP